MCIRDRFIGAEAGRCFCRGQGNVVIGHEVLLGGLAEQEEVDNSVFIGQLAARSIVSGEDAILLGCCVGAGVTNINSGNIWIGKLAGAGSGNSPGPDNVFIGRATGKDITTGGCNIFMGHYTGTNIESGGYNLMLGRGAGQNATTGSYNVFLGCGAGNTITTGAANIAIGFKAGCSSFIVGGNTQLAIGNETNRWIAGDSSFNTTLAGIATAYAATGIVSATKFCGDGSALTGIALSLIHI